MCRRNCVRHRGPGRRSRSRVAGHCTRYVGEVAFFGRTYADVDKEHPTSRDKLKFNEALKRVLNFLVTDLIETHNCGSARPECSTTEDIVVPPQRLAGFSPEAKKLAGALNGFLFAHVYSHPAITEDRDRSVCCLEQLFKHVHSSPGTMPATYEEAATKSSRAIVVCDYIAGMTDQFLLRQHHGTIWLGDCNPNDYRRNR